MPAAVTLATTVVTAPPGGEGTAELRIRNTGAIVDQFACNVLGDASAWARCDPPVLSLLPNVEETVTIRFTPPHTADVHAGAMPFGVRITAKEDVGFSQVEEGTVEVTGFAALEMKVVPRTSQGKRKVSHRVELVNTGNEAVMATLDATDPDDVLAFHLDPPTVEVPPGGAAEARLNVISREPAKGGMRRRPFTVTATQPRGASSTTDAAFEQKPRAKVLVWIAVALVAAVLVLLLRDQADAAVRFVPGA